MARSASRQKMGYLPLSEQHRAPVLSLFGMPTTDHPVRFLDPFAGKGEFARQAEETLGVTSYVNELDANKLSTLVERFGPTRALQGDAERLRASNGAFQLVWINPPYDVFAGEDKENRRTEYKFLKHSWKWVQEPGGLAVWVVYDHHVTDSAVNFFARHSSDVTIYGLPGKHQGEYNQVIVVARRGFHPDESRLYDEIVAQRENPILLAPQDEPIYELPEPAPVNQFHFTTDEIAPERGQELIERYGAHKKATFQSIFEIMEDNQQRQPVVDPRPGHLALVLAAGIANGAVIETVKYGRVAIRSTITKEEEVARIKTVPDPKDPDRSITKTTYRLKPKATLTLTTEDGDVVEMEGDDHLMRFICNNRIELADYLNDKFDPMYGFQYSGLKPFLDNIRIKQTYPLYNSQKHVVAALVRGLIERDSLMLVGQMGTGKTALSVSAFLALQQAMTGQIRGATVDIVEQIQAEAEDARDIILVVCPPHLVKKWQRELIGIAGEEAVFARYMHRHEDVKQFMDEASQPEHEGKLKFGVVARSMVKLGEGWQASYVRKPHYELRWEYGEEPPAGAEETDRIKQGWRPHCPTCGNLITEPGGNDHPKPATKTWLTGGKRTCPTCYEPLWQHRRTFSAPDQPGGMPDGNPRYRLDEYLKRRYPNRIFLLIWDEIHEAKSTTSGNGEALNRLAGISQKVLGLTGTPFNGKASSTFNIEYALNPRTRERYPWGGATRLLPKEPGSQVNRDYHRTVDPASDPSNLQGRSESRWVKDMGVRERVEEERPDYDANTGAYTGTSTYQRPYTEGAGCSPLLIAWMLDHTVFFSLADIGVEDGLPEYREEAIGVDLPEEIQAVYDETMNFLKDYMRERLLQHSDNTFRGAYLAWAMGWVNALFRDYAIIHKRPDEQTGNKEKKVLKTLEAFDEKRVFPKEQKLVDIVRGELADDRPVLIFCRQTNKRDIQPRLESLLEEYVPAANPYILRSSSDTKKREALINRKVEAGTNVLICHPALVRTGLDLLDFVTIVFYEPIYDLYTMLQAAARSYRMNQPDDLVKVMYLYHTGTMEQQAIQLMSRKQRSAKIVTGDIGLSGLDELTSDEGSFEKELMDTLASTQTINDPQALFTRKEDDDYTRIDAAFWNVGSDATDSVDTVPQPGTGTPDSAGDDLFAYDRNRKASNPDPQPGLFATAPGSMEATPADETVSDSPDRQQSVPGLTTDDRPDIDHERIQELLADIHRAAATDDRQHTVQALDSLLNTADRDNLPRKRIPAFGNPRRKKRRRRRSASKPRLSDAPTGSAADEDDAAATRRTRRVIDMSDRDANRARTDTAAPEQIAMF